MLRRVLLLPWLALAALVSLAKADDDPSGWQPDGQGAMSTLSPSGPPISDQFEMAPEMVMSGGSYGGPRGPSYVARHPDPGEPLGFSGARFSPRPGPAVDPGATPGGMFDASYTDYEEPLDPFGPAPATSSGEWVRNGYWYTEQSATYYSRLAGAKNRTDLSFEFISPTAPQENELTAKADMGFEPGLRSTIGRYLGRDVHNRDHSMEFTFLGLMHWNFAKSIDAVDDGTIFQRINPLVGVPVFDAANFQHFDQTSDFNSYEFNYRIDRRMGRDRLTYSRDSCWVREATPSVLCSAFAGVRVVIVNESLKWFSTSQLGTGNYNVITHNNLVGPQAGFDLFYERAYWRAGMHSAFGALVNWASQSSTVQILGNNGNPLVPNRDEFMKDHTLSFAGGLNFIGEYRFRPTFGLRVSYDLQWVSDLVLAQNQLTFLAPDPPRFSDSHSLFLHGVTFGFEWFR